jgi:hypothetical protein
MFAAWMKKNKKVAAGLEPHIIRCFRSLAITYRRTATPIKTISAVAIMRNYLSRFKRDLSR